MYKASTNSRANTLGLISHLVLPHLGNKTNFTLKLQTTHYLSGCLDSKYVLGSKTSMK